MALIVQRFELHAIRAVVRATDMPSAAKRQAVDSPKDKEMKPYVRQSLLLAAQEIFVIPWPGAESRPSWSNLLVTICRLCL